MSSQKANSLTCLTCWRIQLCAFRGNISSHLCSSFVSSCPPLCQCTFGMSRSRVHGIAQPSSGIALDWMARGWLTVPHTFGAWNHMKSKFFFLLFVKNMIRLYASWRTCFILFIFSFREISPVNNNFLAGMTLGEAFHNYHHVSYGEFRKNLNFIWKKISLSGLPLGLQNRWVGSVWLKLDDLFHWLVCSTGLGVQYENCFRWNNPTTGPSNGRRLARLQSGQRSKGNLYRVYQQLWAPRRRNGVGLERQGPDVITKEWCTYY